MATRGYGFWTLAALPSALAAGLAIAPPAALAETVEELDALSQATASEKPGLDLARRQVAAGDLPGALATLERVLMHRPASRDALLLHASLLCRLDDRPGAAVELDYLRTRGATERQRKEAAAPCDPNWKPDAVAPVTTPASAPAPEPAPPPKPRRPRRRPGGYGI